VIADVIPLSPTLLRTLGLLSITTILFAILAIGYMVTGALFEIRNDQWNGILCAEQEQFVTLVKSFKAQFVFKKATNMFVKGKYVYTVVHDGTRYSFIATEDIDGEFPSVVSVVHRSPQVQ
jgi:hypothetical protein